MQPPEGSMDVPYPRDMKTPSLQKKSKAASRVPQPNFIGTPNSAPQRRHWARRVTKQVSSMDKAIDEATRLKNQREKRDEATDYSDQSEAGNSTYSTPIIDKPLPSRPIARMTDLQSPSKDSRGLIDATESPLKAPSPSGATREWQTLTPSRTAPTIAPSTVAFNTSGRDEENSKAPSPVSPMDPPNFFTDQITGAWSDTASPSIRRSVSAVSSYVSATESSIIDGYRDAKVPVLPKLGRKLSAPSSTQRSQLLQQRASLLRGRILSGSVIPREAGAKCDAFTDFTKEASSSSPVEDSRPHSPSAKSFSQPRPNGSSLKTPNGDVQTAMTSSRVPVNEGKKATVVTIPPRASQNSSNDVPQPPTFGKRRLDSKAAEILDNGIKRRQLQRTHTSGTVKNTSSAHASTDTSNVPSLDLAFGSVRRGSEAYSSSESDCDTAIKSDEDMTYAQSSCADTSEVTTPLDYVHPPDEFVKAFKQDKNKQQKKEEKPWDHPHLSKMSMPERCSDKAFMGVTTFPPPTSQHTSPLQTIPSQADLHGGFGKDGDDINQALSQLEGRGNESRDHVNSAAVNQMFGHLKNFWVRSDVSQLKENAAVAERFLAIQESGSCVPGPSRHPSPLPSFGQSRNSVGGPSKTPSSFSMLDQSNLHNVEAAVSKWSNTTPTTPTSERGTMDDGSQIPNHNILQDQICKPEPNPEPQLEPRRPPPPPPKDQRRSQKSIGFPSSVAQTAETLTSFSHQDAVADVPGIPHRGSSPTLGKMRAGPGRVARDSLTMSGALPGFAQPTKAAEARKTSRLPTSSMKPSNQQRGRSPVTLSQYEADMLKIPRARSKSRYVMNKLNGLFHGKRDKQSVTGPHVLSGRDGIPAMRSRLPVSSYDIPARVASPTAPPVPTRSYAAKYNPRGKQLNNKNSEMTMDDGEETLVGEPAASPATPKNGLCNINSVNDLTDRLIARSRSENDGTTKEHLLTLAQALNGALVNARESQISAEKADQAAKRAQTSYEMTQKAVNLLHKLAERVGDAGVESI